MKGQNCIKFLFLISLIFVIIQTAHLRPLTGSEGESESTEVSVTTEETRGSGYTVNDPKLICSPGHRRKSDGSCIKQHKLQEEQK
jgi:hypothetical protein